MLRWDRWSAAQKRIDQLKKVVDAETEVHRVVGSGLIREEVWEDADGKAVPFNLSFINHHLFPEDNGRLLGYDTAHGHLHRHLREKREHTGDILRRDSRPIHRRGSPAEKEERTMKTKVFTDGFAGWTKRARVRAKALDEGRRLTAAREITFENAAEMARLLTPARIDLFEGVKVRPYPMKDLAASLKRDVRAVSRDVTALEKYGIVQSEQVVNPGHGRVRVVSAPTSITISAQL